MAAYIPDISPMELANQFCDWNAMPEINDAKPWSHTPLESHLQKTAACPPINALLQTHRQYRAGSILEPPPVSTRLSGGHVGRTPAAWKRTAETALAG
jgi:hypothetical protein